MKASIRLRDGTIYVGEVISCSLKWNGRTVDFAQVEKIRWGFVANIREDHADLKDGSKIPRVDGQICIRVVSLKEDMTFDIRQCESLSYPPDH
jgi:hypothetical protein